MKHVLTLFILAYAGGLPAQPFFQSFENGIEPMVLYDLDGLTPHTNVSAFPNAWNVANVGFGNGTQVAISNSWYTPVGIADDWMVTPLVELPDSNAIVRWEAKAQDASFRDGYIVYITTTGNTPDDFKEILFQTNGEVPSWTTRTVKLDDYAGQSVYIAFRNNSNDKFLLLMDNIFIGEQKQRDISLVRVNGNINRGTTLEGERTLQITLQNLGLEPLNSANITWELSGEMAVHRLTGINVASGVSHAFAHMVPVNYVVGEGYELNVVVDSINGTDDEQPMNNSYSSGLFKVLPPIPSLVHMSSDGEEIDIHQILASGKAVIFDFFASWCVPCEVSTPALNNLYVANGSGESDLDVIGISIELTDNDSIVNELPWGSTYPNLSYSLAGEEFYTHFNDNHGLGESAIPFFVMICPNPDDPAHSEIIESYIGADQITSVFNNTWQNSKDDCIESLMSAVEEIPSIQSMSIVPNPASDDLNLEFSVSEPTAMAIEVLDATGKSVLRYPVRTFPTGANTEHFDVSTLASGTYFIRLTEQRNVSTLRFTVVH